MHSDNVSYIVSFYRFPQCVISTTGCTVGTSPMQLWFPGVNRNLDIFKGLAIKAEGYNIWKTYITDLMNRCLDKNSSSVQRILTTISVPCVLNY